MRAPGGPLSSASISPLLRDAILSWILTHRHGGTGGIIPCRATSHPLSGGRDLMNRVPASEYLFPRSLFSGASLEDKVLLRMNANTSPKPVYNDL